MWGRRTAFTAALLGAAIIAPACASEYDERGFQREAEKIYMEVNPGFGIMRRTGTKSTFVRGDQVYVLDVGPLYTEYKLSGASGSKYLEEWRKRLEEEVASRRRTLEQARETIVPIIKSGSWIRVQDLGAIGPRREQDKLRPWRKEVAKDVFVLLGVPEELLGYRYVSIHEIGGSATAEDEWLKLAIANSVRQVGSSTDASELRAEDDRLLVYDLSGVDGVSALILDRGFRAKMLELFQKTELGAAVPNRDVLIVFDATDFVTIKPIRARTRSLYDARNHPGFRGLLRFDRDTLSVLDSGRDEEQKSAGQ